MSWLGWQKEWALVVRRCAFSLAREAFLKGQKERRKPQKRCRSASSPWVPPPLFAEAPRDGLSSSDSTIEQRFPIRENGAGNRYGMARRVRLAAWRSALAMATTTGCGTLAGDNVISTSIAAQASS